MKIGGEVSTDDFAINTLDCYKDTICPWHTLTVELAISMCTSSTSFEQKQPTIISVIAGSQHNISFCTTTDEEVNNFESWLWRWGKLSPLVMKTITYSHQAASTMMEKWSIPWTRNGSIENWRLRTLQAIANRVQHENPIVNHHDRSFASCCFVQ